ncbi:uncharacterized protein LOC119979937 [Tripterygium wilfordii]|uniref:uncharacterized protein LOC119979937 n=1 Tax=Tripterygium wilfordii TaxID=458696 RepID=UPI0018F80ED6|nr:uncharacterized protein LOC119979937 [Tripterygium wilfordii]
MVIVSGNVDPKILIDKFAKWGRKAQLLSFQNQKDSSSDQHLKIANDNFDSDDDDSCHCEANKKQNGSVSRQHPSLKISAQSSKEKPNIIITKTRKGRFAWFWNLFRRKKSSSPEFSRVRSPTTTKGSSADTGRYPRPRRPNNNRYPFEPIYETPRSNNWPYSYQRIMLLSPPPPPPPPPPPYGIYGSTAARNHPQTIHYSSYRDNYFPDLIKPTSPQSD